MNKKELRKLYRQRRIALSAAERADLETRVAKNFNNLPLPALSILMSYYPMRQMAEFNPETIEKICAQKNETLSYCYPRTSGNEMNAIRVNSATTFAINHLGVREPSDGWTVAPAYIDLIIVPLLAFDHEGFRVGYGGGYYDRFLSTCRQDVITVGCSYFEPVDTIDDINTFDIPLKYCVTPNALYAFSS